MDRIEQSSGAGEEEQQRIRDLVEKAAYLGFNLNKLLGEGWEDQLENVENEDFQGTRTESGPDRHISSVKLKDGRMVEMMSAKVKSGNPFEHMEHLGGADFRKAEGWLYTFDPSKNTVTIISPDGKTMEVEGTKEDFDAQMEEFRKVYANVHRSIASFGGSPEKQKEGGE